MEPKRIQRLTEYAPYTKGKLIELYGCNYQTLQHYMEQTGLTLAGLRVPRGPHGAFLDIKYVLMVHFVWFGVSKLRMTYKDYREMVVKKGKALRFWDVFSTMTGGGSLVMALEEFWLPSTTHAGQRQVMEFLIDYIRNKEERKHG